MSSDLVVSFVTAMVLIVIIPAAMLLGDARADRRRIRAVQRAVDAA
jgi:hypothetical protein